MIIKGMFKESMKKKIMKEYTSMEEDQKRKENNHFWLMIFYNE